MSPTSLRSVGPADGATLLRAQALARTFTPSGRPPVVLFRDLSFTVASGELVAVVGRSGSGKSSLLHLLAALDRPTAGEVWFADTCVTNLTGAEAARFRNREVGYVWQFHYLLPEFTAVENVSMPLLARGVRRPAAEREASHWLEEVGLGDRGTHRAGELSGGEQQRVSLARALVTRPRLLLADEPTGDLDETTAESIFALIRSLQQRLGLAGMLVTHHPGLAACCDRTLHLQNGVLETDASSGA